MEALVKSHNVCWVCQVCPAMSLGKMEFVYLLHLVTHPWKLQRYHVVLVGYGVACPKFTEITNRHYL